MKVDDLIKKVKDFREKQLLESGQPYIGIFYIIDNDVQFRGEHPRLIQPIGDFKMFNSDNHKNYWYQVLVKHNQTAKYLFDKFDKGKEISFMYLPRGRVVCDSDNTNFMVFCDRHILNNDAIKSKIRNEMSLPFNTGFRLDSYGHYLCYDCDPSTFPCDSSIESKLHCYAPGFFD